MKIDRRADRGASPQLLNLLVQMAARPMSAVSRAMDAPAADERRALAAIDAARAVTRSRA